jgi:Tol biopolymer transport system component
MAADGSAQTAAGRGAQPDWSPDGRHLTLVVRRGALPSSLYVQAADGSHRRRVRLPGLGRFARGPVAPRWSADGHHIFFLAYTRGEEPRSALFRVRSDGRGQTLIRHFARGTYVAFAPSPDGRQVAFSQVVHRPRSFVVFTMPASGGNARRLVDLGPGEDPPGRIDWSPDGAQLTFDGDGVRVAEVDGGRLVTLAADGFNPTFSPDGRALAFAHYSEGRYEGSFPWILDVMRVDGLGRHEVAVDDRGVAWPSWQARPAR